MAGMIWFRYYVEALNDPKIQQLPDDLFKLWVNLLCVARQNDGALPEAATLAFQLRVDESRTRDAIRDLTDRVLLDQTAAGLMPHNWQARQYQSDLSTERVKRHRVKAKSETLSQRSTKRGGGVSETPPDTDTDAEQIQSRADAEQKGTPVSFDEWADWQAFILWIMCSLDEDRGRFPLIVKDGLEQRCPGFVEAEQKRVAECLAGGEPYSFVSEFIPGLLGWGFRVVFAGRPLLTEPIPGMEDRGMAYSHDWRHDRVLSYLRHLDKTGFHARLNAGELDEYPTFERWREAAWTHPAECAVCQGASEEVA
jgi:hypothetical protein